MYTALLVVHVSISLAIIALVLLQHGKGADAGAAFGSGASGTVFGSRGSASFLSRITGALAAGFFVTSLTLAILAGTFSDTGSVMDDVSEPAPATEPVPTDEPVPPPAGADAPAAPAPPPAE
jgi:preprotein translocase subunit SecG